MASFTNFATLIYNGGTSNSNTVTGELRLLDKGHPDQAPAED